MHTTVVILFSVWNLFGLLSSEKGQIADLSCVCRSGRLVVQCRLADIDGDEIWKALSAGEEIDFSYRFTLFRERRFWFSETLHDNEYHKYLQYNNLTKQFIGKTDPVWGRGTGGVILGDFHAAVRWLSLVQELSLPVDTGDLSGGAVLRAKVRMNKRRLLYVIPFETVSNARQIRVSCP